jgi:hypothetical protein
MVVAISVAQIDENMAVEPNTRKSFVANSGVVACLWLATQLEHTEPGDAFDVTVEVRDR